MIAVRLKAVLVNFNSSAPADVGVRVERFNVLLRKAVSGVSLEVATMYPDGDLTGHPLSEEEWSYDTEQGRLTESFLAMNWTILVDRPDDDMNRMIVSQSLSALEDSKFCAAFPDAAWTFGEVPLELAG